jgi:hypothetical protein
LLALEREADAESTDRVTLIRDLLDVQCLCCTNVRQTLRKAAAQRAAADHGLRFWHRRRPLRAFSSTASIPLNDEGRVALSADFHN